MRVVILLTVLMAYLSCSAQEFKESIIYDVRGPVKKVMLYSNRPNIHYLDRGSFMPDGKSVNSITRFDDDGYPVGWSINLDSLNNGGHCICSFKVNYDNCRNVSYTMMEYDVTGSGYELSNGLRYEFRVFNYTTDQHSLSEISEMTKVSKLNDKKYVSKYKYSGYIYDDRGNWISRNVEETKFSGKSMEKTGRIEYVETRDIDYYD